MTIKKYTTQSGATYYHDVENARVLRLGGHSRTDILNGQWRYILNHSEIEVGKPIHWFLGDRNDLTTTPVQEIETVIAADNIQPYEQGSTLEDEDYE